MSKNVDVNFDYRRAVLLLKNRINTPMDLIKIWAFCGPFHGDCPDVEKIPKSSWQSLTGVVIIVYSQRQNISYHKNT